ncbi:MAG: hypothetical protein LQ341_002163 [Variospora aurantia]|nr:MAG: hypothetical protein LQ341_002163 [Variospora aurantia]
MSINSRPTAVKYPEPSLGWHDTTSFLTTTAKSLAFHSYSLWLFIYSDLKTIVGPSLVFGVANGLAAQNSSALAFRPVQQVSRRTPIVAVWVLTNLMPFAINNQTATDAIEEDKINKPWRTLPAGRMSLPQAKRLMLALYPLAIVTALGTGGTTQSVSLVVLGTWYNNFGGGDESWVIRNTINAFGYVCFTSGAMEVAIGMPLPFDARLMRWFGIIAAIIFSTVHLQDMYDQTGDLVRGRKTVPLVFGDRQARWSIAIAMTLWGWICPWYWNGRTLLLMTSTLMAVSIAARSLLFRTVGSDRLTFKLWTAWVTFVFIMPLASQGQGRD